MELMNSITLIMLGIGILFILVAIAVMLVTTAITYSRHWQ